jgi:DNA-binding beta-propeller fold protein YncE
MKPGCTLAFALLLATFVRTSCAKDWLFITTNWNEYGNEQVLLIDRGNNHIRTVWSGGAEVDAIVSPDATRLYVSFIENQSEWLAVIDISNGAVLQRLEIPQLIHWIFPTAPAMVISANGRWLSVLKTNYSAGSDEYFLMMFDTQAGQFVSGEQVLSRCTGPRLIPRTGAATRLALCGGVLTKQASDDDSVLRFGNIQNFALGQGVTGNLLYVAGVDGRIRAVDLATHEITRTSKDEPLRYRRFMLSSGTLSPDGRLWYLPIKIPNNGEQDIEQILVFDTQTMSRVNVITPCRPFRELALSSDGHWLYASEPDTTSIMIIDTDTGQTVQTISVGAKPSIIFAVKAP